MDLGIAGVWDRDYGWGVRVRRPFGARGRNSVRYGTRLGDLDDDHPFIVLTETKFSFRCIPVGIGTLLTGLGLKKKKHM